MKYGLLLGMTMAVALSIPAFGGTLTGTADSIIIGNVTYAPGQNQVSVPVYFVTAGEVTHYNVPLIVESSGDILFSGREVGTALEGWDDNWQGLKNDRRHAVQMGFSDLGGDNNPSLNTHGQRVLAFTLNFAIIGDPSTQVAAIMPEIDDRSGGPLFGYSDGVVGTSPIVINGSLTKGSSEITTPEVLPREISLSQNYPNPFNPTTDIEYALPDARQVKLTVFNVLGQNIRNLVSGSQEAGFHKVTWDGKDNAGSTVPSGAYFYKLEAGSFSQSMKMVLLK